MNVAHKRAQYEGLGGIFKQSISQNRQNLTPRGTTVSYIRDVSTTVYWSKPEQTPADYKQRFFITKIKFIFTPKCVIVKRTYELEI